jgi:hypothetical protein
MKQLDWKSFAIGVLLTTTVMFGTAAKTSTTRENGAWDSSQSWKVKSPTSIGSNRGFEPFSVDRGIVYFRKREY